MGRHIRKGSNVPTESGMVGSSNMIDCGRPFQTAAWRRFGVGKTAVPQPLGGHRVDRIRFSQSTGLSPRLGETASVGELEPAESVKRRSGVDPSRPHKEGRILARSETPQSVQPAAREHALYLIESFADGEFSVADVLQHAPHDPGDRFALAALDDLFDVGKADRLVVQDDAVRPGRLRFRAVALHIFGKRTALRLGNGPRLVRSFARLLFDHLARPVRHVVALIGVEHDDPVRCVQIISGSARDDEGRDSAGVGKRANAIDQGSDGLGFHERAHARVSHEEVGRRRVFVDEQQACAELDGLHDRGRLGG